MGGHHQALARLNGGSHLFVPERNDAGHGVFQALGQRNLLGWQAGVADIAALAARVGGFQGRWRGVIAATPDQHLLIAILLGHVGLVQTLQAAVVALVQLPGLDHGQPGAVHLVQRQPQGADGPFEHAGIGHIEFIAFGLEQAACVAGLFHAGGGQIDIGPAGEAVFEVPGGFTVADEHEFVHGIEVERGLKNAGLGGQGRQ